MHASDPGNYIQFENLFSLPQKREETCLRFLPSEKVIEMLQAGLNAPRR